MIILLSTDNNYVMPTGVLMTSIGINEPGKVHYFIIVDEEFSNNSKKMLHDVATLYHADIDFCIIGVDFVKRIPFTNEEMSQGLTITTFYRLFLTELLPADIHKIIYLDVDMIVRKSLQPLWNLDMKEYAIAGVPDMDEYEHVLAKRLPYPMDTGYLNAGMLVINIDYWREHNMFPVFMSFIKENKNILFANDQDTLNCLFYDKKKILSPYWNFQNGFLYHNKKYRNNLDIDIEKGEKDPAIIHYTGKKPWDINCNNPQRFAWYYYMQLSLWKDFKVEKPKNLKMRIWYWLFRNNHWWRNISILPFNKHKRVVVRK